MKSEYLAEVKVITIPNYAIGLLLPSVVGTGISAGLIAYSQALAYLSIIVIFGFNGITIYKLRKEIARTRTLRCT